MKRGVGARRILPRVGVVAALLACLHAVPVLAAPTVTIDSGPDGPNSESSPTFGFTVENATVTPEDEAAGVEEVGSVT